MNWLSKRLGCAAAGSRRSPRIDSSRSADIKTWIGTAQDVDRPPRAIPAQTHSSGAGAPKQKKEEPARTGNSTRYPPPAVVVFE
jgi:hypothetical protein